MNHLKRQMVIRQRRRVEEMKGELKDCVEAEKAMDRRTREHRLASERVNNLRHWIHDLLLQIETQELLYGP